MACMGGSNGVMAAAEREALSKDLRDLIRKLNDDIDASDDQINELRDMILEIARVDK